MVTEMVRICKGTITIHTILGIGNLLFIFGFHDINYQFLLFFDEYDRKATLDFGKFF
jgi:hypothetical protein